MRKPIEVKAAIAAILLASGYRIAGFAVGPSSVSVTVSLDDSDDERARIEAENQLRRRSILVARASRAERAAEILQAAGLPVIMQYRERVAVAVPGEFLLSLADERMDESPLEGGPAPEAAGDRV